MGWSEVRRVEHSEILESAVAPEVITCARGELFALSGDVRPVPMPPVTHGLPPSGQFLALECTS